MTALVKLVVARFAEVGLGDLAGLGPSERAAVDELRAAFVAAGAAHLRRMATEDWLQVGVSFLDRAQAGRFRAALGPWLDERAWFMNKPPGLRLRFPLGEGRTEAPVLSWLEDARERGLVADFELGVYDPETHQFGGPAGLALFHAFSAVDCRQILQFEALEAAGETTVDRSVLSVLAMTDLVARVADDPWEQWDAWCEMALTGRLVDPDSEAATELRASLAENRDLLTALLFRRAEVVAELSAEERALLDAYGRASQAVADGLRDAARRRQLGCGPRKILPFYVIFHWNRLGLELDEQLAFSFFLWELLNPKGERG